MNTYGFSELEAEDILARERAERIQDEIQSRIYRGELEVTDADGVETMKDHQ